MTALKGYRTLKKRDFRASKLGAFGSVKHQRIMVSRKPLKRVCFLGRSNEWYLDLEIVTSRSEAVRAAVHVYWVFLDAFGRQIKRPQIECNQTLFADPVEYAAPQRLWIKKPEKAVFAVMAFSRIVKGKDIGLSAKLRLKKGKDDIADEAAHLLLSRDRLTLERALDFSIFSHNHQTTKHILSRMVYLWRKPTDRRELELFEDARTLAETRFGMDNIPEMAVKSGVIFEYSQLFGGDLDETIPLSKQLNFELQLLISRMKTAKVSDIIVSKGSNYLLRLIIAHSAVKNSPINITADVPLDTLVAADEQISRYIAFSEIQDFLNR